MELLVRRETLAINNIRVSLLQRQLVIADAGATFTQLDLGEAVAQLDRERDLMEAELIRAQDRRDAALRALLAARNGSAPSTNQSSAAEVISRR